MLAVSGLGEISINGSKGTRSKDHKSHQGHQFSTGETSVLHLVAINQEAAKTGERHI